MFANVDDIDNKRLEVSGVLCYDLFHKLYKRFLGQVRTNYAKTNNVVESVKNANMITNGMLKCFLSERWGAVKTSYTRAGVSQVLARLSYCDTISHLRRISIPVENSAKVIKVRSVNSSQAMFICPTKTPEEQNVGIVLNMAVSACVSERRCTTFIQHIVSEHVQPRENSSQAIVVVCGLVTGFTNEPEKLVKTLLGLKKEQILQKDVSIFYAKTDNAVHVISDEGRFIRPVMVGGIRYVDYSEIKHANTISFEKIPGSGNMYEISPSFMLGVMASTIPYINHSQSPRNCYQSSMGKQAVSVPALNFALRTNAFLNVSWYSQKPIISTVNENALGLQHLPSGLTAVVAIVCYGGYNQEDSIIMNKASIDRGLFMADHYKTYTEEETSCLKITKHEYNKLRYDYSFLDDSGVIRHGSVVGPDTVLISACKESNDASTVSLYEGQVSKVINVTEGKKRLVKVVVRSLMIPQVGDKFTSRSAQKGTCGIILPQEDMPFTKCGMTPDIIINPHAIPSRMTINHLLETVVGKRCDRLEQVDSFSTALKDQNFDDTGCEIMYNGMTGQKMKTQIFYRTDVLSTFKTFCRS